MKHFYRTHALPDAILAEADAFFPAIGMAQTTAGPRARGYEGVVGEPDERAKLSLTVKMEGGHYTFIEAQSSATGESRLDRNIKKFFVRIHRHDDADHATGAAY
jgi:hypothetical protein